MDEFLSQIIDALTQYKIPSVLVYISDHGEQLGEGGKWLHAQAGEAAKNPAYLMWFSKQYQKRYPKIVGALTSQIHDTSTTDRVFYDLLNLLGIE